MEQLEVWCSDASQLTTFHLKVDPQNLVEFQCFTPTWLEENLLPVLDVGPTHWASFMYCSLLNASLHQILESIGTSGIEYLVYEHSNLSGPLQSSFLTGLDNLKSLTLHSNGIKSLPVDFFQNMTKLQYLDMKDNALQLPLHVFDSLSNLLTLELGSNQMTNLEVGMFRNLSRLNRLNLWSNNLQNLTQGVFTGLSSLKFLDLSSNKLTSIYADLFANMPLLTELFLANNNFTSLPGGLLSRAKNLTKLGLYNNRQQLKHVPPGLLANLTKLEEVDLHACGISSLPEDIFWGSTAIINISLTGNLLTSLPADLFRDTVQLRNLRLGYNRLQILPDGVFSTLSNLRVLELHHNWLANISG
jgi:protein toll